MSLARNIRNRRVELGMSQQELANAAGYSSRSTIAKIESGDNDIPRAKLSKVAQALGVSVDVLLDEGAPSSREPHATTMASVGQVDTTPSPGSRARNVAVVLAAGSSTRNQQDIPNQFINLLGKPMIIYALEAYQRHPVIDEIHVVCLEGWEAILEGYVRRYGITKFAGIVPGGSSGVRSAMNAVDRLEARCSREDVVILQESTRPLVSEETISKLLLSCGRDGNAVTCESMYDRIQFRMSEGSVEYIDRSELLCVQSPEAYRYGMLSEAFERARQSDFAHLLEGTYCALLLHELGYDIRFCEGDRNNIKAVHPEDIAILTALIGQSQGSWR